MENNVYAKAYSEVLEIIKYFPKNEFLKIPKEKILFFETYKDKNYDFKIDPKISLEKQNISEEANAIIIILYRDYFATESQKIKFISSGYPDFEKEENVLLFLSRDDSDVATDEDYFVLTGMRQGKWNVNNEEVIAENGIGTISEIYDGNPPHESRGCISQSTSVAALLYLKYVIDGLKK